MSEYNGAGFGVGFVESRNNLVPVFKKPKFESAKLSAIFGSNREEVGELCQMRISTGTTLPVPKGSESAPRTSEDGSYFITNTTPSNGEAVFSVLWTPQADSLKLNVDGAFLAVNSAAFGLVIRDQGGLFVAAKCGKASAVSALQSEALTVLNGLLFAQDLQFKKVIIESDNKSLINWLKKKEINCPTEISAIVQDCLKVASFSEVSSFVKRLENKTAHVAAQRGLLGPEQWLDAAPFWLAGALADWSSG
ncbi:PREDICTED: uncharacterized protein LOC104610550 isoform X1 [Nelumbo nucifera]|uniref:RNase H type-1 domain-containing protein n=2 Tax=Nelumbo nucifera TaxID=4432 RepID=A0A822XKZ5_NELNU|nr:PREDICTED: uncharacterized protein LOC104610550 isoform X1 [Nelumbo nucifera]DAD22284.1 TPA_asm: hypothetical protein HUJ06_023747 [Nelumbo nucifera]